MNLQVINSTLGQPEYVLLPVRVYHELRAQIENKLKKAQEDEYVPFILEDYISNPIALARIKATITQEELAEFMGVTQAYVSKVERQNKVTGKALEKVHMALIDGEAEKSKESKVMATKKIQASHPGKILKEDFLSPLGISNYRLAKELNVPAQRVCDIVNGKRAVSPDAALRLATYFNTTAELWLGLQMEYDLRMMANQLDKEIKREVKLCELIDMSDVA